MAQDSQRHLEKGGSCRSLLSLWTAPDPYARVTGHDPHGHGPKRHRKATRKTTAGATGQGLSPIQRGTARVKAVA